MIYFYVYLLKGHCTGFRFTSVVMSCMTNCSIEDAVSFGGLLNSQSRNFVELHKLNIDRPLKMAFFSSHLISC